MLDPTFLSRHERDLRKNLLYCARINARARGVALSTVAEDSHGYHRFFAKIMGRKPVSFTAKKYDQIMSWMGDLNNWPDESVPLKVKAVIENPLVLRK